MPFSSTFNMVSAVAGGLMIIKGAKWLRSLNDEIPWYKDYISFIVSGIGAVSLCKGVHRIVIRAGLSKSYFCKM